MSEDRSENYLGAQGVSPTAASAHNRLYQPSGEMLMRVTMTTGAGLAFVDVMASSGDEAAEKAHAKFMGGKVTQVVPAPQSATKLAKAA